MIIQSHASKEYYPDNKATLFKNHIAPAIQLDDGEWEMAILNVTYPNNIITFKDDLEFVALLYNTDAEFSADDRVIPKTGELIEFVNRANPNRNTHRFKSEKSSDEQQLFHFKHSSYRLIKIRPDFFASPEHLCKHIQTAIENAFPSAQLNFNIYFSYSLCRVCVVSTPPSCMSLFFTDTRLFDMLGFGETDDQYSKIVPFSSRETDKPLYELPNDVHANDPPRFDDLRTFYVYSRLASLQIIGDSLCLYVAQVAVDSEKRGISQSHSKISHMFVLFHSIFKKLR
jgi:hypothetical protein